MSAKNILINATKAAGDHSHAKQVWIIHPLLEQMAIAFADYVGMESLDENGKPLLVTAIKKALDVVRKNEDNDKLAISGFTKTLLSYGSDVFAQVAIMETPRGDVQWSAFACGMSQFKDQFPDTNLVVTRGTCNVSKDIAEVFMMTKIIPPTLLDQKSLAELLNEPEMV